MAALGFRNDARQRGRMKRFILLLRAVNVGSSRKLEMKPLREAAQAQGFPDLITYIQSGNLVFSADGNEASVEEKIEALIAKEFGLKAIAIARATDHFERIAAANPFATAIPKLLHLCLSKYPAQSDSAALLTERAKDGEQIALAGGELWIDFADSGVARSKLTPAAIDKAAGSTVTARNWNTVQKLIELAKA
jgi:uncharacterized protein (DUF1697 family)